MGRVWWALLLLSGPPLKLMMVLEGANLCRRGLDVTVEVTG